MLQHKAFLFSILICASLSCGEDDSDGTGGSMTSTSTSAATTASGNGGAGGADCDPRPTGAGGAGDGGSMGTSSGVAITSTGSGIGGGEEPPVGRLKCFDPETGTGFDCATFGYECCEKKDVCWEPAVEPTFCDRPYC
jgi:hypothetical protein